MSRVAASTLLLVLAASALRAGDVEFSYDETVDFSVYETFVWGEAVSETPDPALRGELRTAVRARLVERGLRKQEVGADLGVFVHAGQSERILVTRESFGYGGWPDWNGWYTWRQKSGFKKLYVPVVIEAIPEGMLVVDLVDVRYHELVWRGLAPDVVVEEPSLRRKEVDEALARMFKHFPPEAGKAYEERAALRESAEAMALFYTGDVPHRPHVLLVPLRAVGRLQEALDKLRFLAAAQEADLVIDIRCRVRKMDGRTVCTGHAARWSNGEYPR